MTNTIGAPVTSAPVATNYQQISSQQAAQSQNQNNNVQPTKVNPAKESQDANVSSQDNSETSSQSRLDAIKQLIQQRYAYPLGEYYRVTIYEGKPGEYTTIETSLKTGQTTTIEPQALASNGSRVSTEA